MRELVVIVSDLYLSRESPERGLPQGIALPGLQHLLRFGTRCNVLGGWRPWLARRVSADWQAQAAPATIAATGERPAANQPAWTVWMASPVHLVAGLTSVHLDRRSLLRLDPGDSHALAADFQRVFHDSGFWLRPLETGDFLLFGPRMPLTERPEPAYLMGHGVAEAHTVGSPDDRTLRRLGAEVEMWLHEHAINDARRRRGELAVTGLWFWGGGPAPGSGPAPERPDRDVPPIAFGRDAYVQGLWASMGEKVHPAPERLAEIFSYPRAERAAVVLELGPMLQSNPAWTFFDAVMRVDHDFVMPAIDALARGRLDRFVFVANDRQLALRPRDRFKIWRRARPGLSGLQ